MVYVILINEFYTQPTNAFLVGVKKFLIKNLNIYTFPIYSNCVLSLKFLVLTHVEPSLHIRIQSTDGKRKSVHAYLRKKFQATSLV